MWSYPTVKEAGGYNMYSGMVWTLQKELEIPLLKKVDMEDFGEQVVVYNMKHPSF